MAEMILNRLTMSNFKGVKNLEVRFAHDRTDIRGKNATGKTTLVDAFCWVLWNKDSNDNAPGSDAFHEKPLDHEGHEIHYLTTEVELDCTLDGKPFVLKRSQQEHWEKKRGFVDEVYKGNESTYWINGIETKVSEFKARIAEIIPTDVFKLIGKLGAFNSLKWQDRRTALLGLSDCNVDKVLLEQPGYAALAKELEETGYTVDELRQNLSDRRKMINDTLKMIPVRIDEAKKGIATYPEHIEDLQYVADEAALDIETVRKQMYELTEGSDVAARNLKISTLEAQADLIKRGMRSDLIRQREDAERVAKNERESLERLKAYMGDAAVRSAKLAKDIDKAIAQRDALRLEFAEAKGMPVEVAEVCPTCGKPLDPEQIESARNALISNRKSAMDNIRTKGKQAAETVTELTTEREEVGRISAEAAAKVNEQEARLNAVIIALNAIPTAPDYESNEELQAMLREIDNLHNDEAKNIDDKVDAYNARIEELKRVQSGALQKISEIKACESRKVRIAELEKQRKTEGANLAAAEKMLDLVENFIRDRCSSLEESINRKFDNVRWKLFNTQINGGLADCCVCMIPCAAGLVSYECANTASQINADIEIVRNLSQHYGVKLPLFVDNCERINKVADAGTQMITLSVSTDDELKLEETNNG